MCKVSVLMAVYNNESTLEEALQSIIDQDFNDWELVVIDDYSDDNTSKLLTKYSESDKRIKIIKNDVNLGLAISLNKGIQACNSELIARMDGDDIMLQGRLRTQFEFMTQNPEIGVLGGGAVIMDTSGCGLNIVMQPETHDEIRKTLALRNPVNHPSVMYRRSVIIGHKYNEKLRKKQDYELWSRLIDKVKFYNLQIPLIKYRVKQKENIASIFLGFCVHIIIALRLKRMIGIFYAVAILIKSLLVEIGLYIPVSRRKRTDDI